MTRLRALATYAAARAREFEDARCALAAGGLAYFVAISVAPATVAIGSVAGLLVDPAVLHDTLARLAQRSPGTVDGARTALDSLVSLAEQSSASTFTVVTVVAILVSAYGAAKVVVGVRDEMNTVFGTHGVRRGLLARIVATVATLIGLVVAVALLVGLAFVPRVLTAFGVEGWATWTGARLLDWLVFAAVTVVVVRSTLQHAPTGTARVPWRSWSVAVGSVGILAVTAGVGLYAQAWDSLSPTAVVFGTAVVVLLWLYLCFLGLLWAAVIEADRQRSGREPAGWTGDERGDERGRGTSDAG